MLVDEIEVASGKPVFNLNVSPLNPLQITHTEPESFNASTCFRVLLGETEEHANRRMRFACAGAARGQAAAEAANNLMKSRRLIVAP
jgi:hypothetical protein